MWHTRSSYFHLLYSATVNSITIFRFYCSNLVFMVKKRRRKKRSQSLCDTLAAFSFLWSMRSLVLTYRIPWPERYECGLSMEINKSENRRKLGHRPIEISWKRNIFSIFEERKKPNPCTIRRYWYLLRASMIFDSFLFCFFSSNKMRNARFCGRCCLHGRRLKILLFCMENRNARSVLCENRDICDARSSQQVATRNYD